LTCTWVAPACSCMCAAQGSLSRRRDNTRPSHLGSFVRRPTMSTETGRTRTVLVRHGAGSHGALRAQQDDHRRVPAGRHTHTTRAHTHTHTHTAHCTYTRLRAGSVSNDGAQPSWWQMTVAVNCAVCSIAPGGVSSARTRAAGRQARPGRGQRCESQGRRGGRRRCESQGRPGGRRRESQGRPGGCGSSGKRGFLDSRRG
jgi:hypothetical protein